MKYIFTLLSGLSFLLSNHARAQAVEKADSLALIDLYNKTNGASWTHHDNWLSTSPVSTWYGITASCNRVIGIDLSVNNLDGRLPSSLDDLSGLQSLYAYSNKLKGSLPSLSELVNLRGLLIGSNRLTGSLPSSLGKLKSLEQLDVSNNKLSGSIPFAIGSLTNAQFINLNNNKLTGRIPVTIGKLAAIRILEMAGNRLNGSIPSEVGNLENLLYLYLQDNKLIGNIPPSVCNLKSLLALYLDDNKLSGSIPDNIGNLTSLQLLSASNNQLTGTVPFSFGDLVNLSQLYLNNNELRGALPASFFKLPNLQYMHIDHNHLSQGINKNPVFPLNVFLHADISHNDFTFDGMEFLATHYPFVTYSPQASLSIHKNGDNISLYAGGTLSNNFYIWYHVEDRSSTAIKGDSSFHPAAVGHYYAQVRNVMATQLVLYTDTFEYVMPAATNKVTASLAGIRNNSVFSVYPNPAHDMVHIKTEGNGIITITDMNGRMMLTKTVSGNDAVDVSRFAAGVYYVRNQTTGEVQKMIVVR